MIRYGSLFYLIGITLFIFSAVMLFPGIVDFFEGNEICCCFAISALAYCFCGGLLFFPSINADVTSLNIRERTVFVILIWVLLPFLGVLPLVLSSSSVSFTNALFETTSAITGTGATAFDVADYSDGFLVWRALLQFFGGILFVFTCVYIFPAFKQVDRYIHEGSQNYTLQKIAKSVGIFAAAKVLIALIGAFSISAGGLSAIHSFCCSFSAISSSGMLPTNLDFLQSYDEFNWICSALMFISGISISFISNFLIEGRFELRNKQFICYVCIILLCSAFFATRFFYTSDIGLMKSIEKSLFMALSSITTTGLQNCDDAFVNNVLYVLNFCGGCSGSSTGGMKVFRLMTVFLIVKMYFIKLMKTNAVYVPSFDGRRISEFDITNLLSYFVCFIALAILFSTILSLLDMDFGKAFSSVITAMNNNGPFFGSCKATADQVATLSTCGKSILIAAMISGRLEFVLFFMIVSRIFWKR